MIPDAVMESCLYTEDLEAAEAFYGRVLGLEFIRKETGRHVFFRCGSGVVLIFNPKVTSTQLTEVNGAIVPLHGARGAVHLAFRVTREALDGWRRHLAAEGVAIESEINWPQGGRSIYFRDPGGNSLELVTAATWGMA